LIQVNQPQAAAKIPMGLMKASFTTDEIKYLTAWAIEDHLGRAKGRARTLQREHHVHAVVLGTLFAVWCRDTSQNQMDLVDGSYPEGPIEWPWPAKGQFEARLKELLGESLILYREEFVPLEKEASRI
jgi:hypothetical protein